MDPSYHVADFSQIEAVPCPCGTARRAFTNVDALPGTLHVTDISEDAKKHYHKTLTETYFVLECGSDARMELNDDIIDLNPGISIVIPPGVQHRALGKMKVLIVVFPKFDPTDEYLV